MDKRVGLSLDSVVEHLRSNTALIERLPASDLHSQDGRVASRERLKTLTVRFILRAPLWFSFARRTDEWQES